MTRYICDLRFDPLDEDIVLPAIQAEFPMLSIQAVESHSADPTIPRGRVRCTIANVSDDQHAAILAVTGVSVAA